MDTLADHNLEGQAVLLWGTLEDSGWLKLLPIKLLKFSDVGLPDESTDREVWRFVMVKRLAVRIGEPEFKPIPAIPGTRVTTHMIKSKVEIG
ncbi:MAG: hypothetical protein HZB77_07430 [Chloroflexi bacterium]|nr:hypothetical protein [Chloroflexota bacterium]